MQYFKFKGYKTIYRENNNNTFDKYLEESKSWVDAILEVMDAIYGFDDSEPVGSPYRYGNSSCMLEREHIDNIDIEYSSHFILI